MMWHVGGLERNCGQINAEIRDRVKKSGDSYLCRVAVQLQPKLPSQFSPNKVVLGTSHLRLN